MVARVGDMFIWILLLIVIGLLHISIVSCQKGPTCYAYARQIGPYWQDTLDMT